MFMFNIDSNTLNVGYIMFSLMIVQIYILPFKILKTTNNSLCSSWIRLASPVLVLVNPTRIFKKPILDH